MIAYAPWERGSTVTASRKSVGSTTTRRSRDSSPRSATRLDRRRRHGVRAREDVLPAAVPDPDRHRRASRVHRLPRGSRSRAAVRAVVRPELHLGAAQRAAGSRGDLPAHRPHAAATHRHASRRGVHGLSAASGARGTAQARARRRARRELRSHGLEPAAAARSAAASTRSTTCVTCSRRGSSSTPSSAGSAGATGSPRTARACSPSSPSPTRRRSGRSSKACTACRSRRSAPRSRSCAGAKQPRKRAIGRAAGCSRTRCCSRSRRHCRSDADALGALAQSKFIARSAPAMLAALASRTDAELQAEVRANAAQAEPDKALVKSLQERVRQHAAGSASSPRSWRRAATSSASRSAILPPTSTGWRAKELAAS